MISIKRGRGTLNFVIPMECEIHALKYSYIRTYDCFVQIISTENVHLYKMTPYKKSIV